MSLQDVIADQAGVITLAQAVANGMSAATVHRRARSGEWTRLYPSVYLVGGHRLTDEVRVRAAWLWAGEGAVVTGEAAAFWHRMLDRAPAVIEVTVPGARKPRRQPGVRLRRRDLAFVDLVGIRGIRLAAAPFAALETAVSLPDGSTFLDRALQKHVKFPTFYRSFCRNIGRHGSSEAGRLIIAAANRADSTAERLLTKLLRDAGITGWVLGYPFGRYRIDLAFPASKLAIEVDGWAWHVDAERFRNDRRKGNAITREKWDLLRFTWHDLDGSPAGTVQEIEAMISANGTSAAPVQVWSR
jgi:very-short-patch-repair endonuclease